MPATISVDTVSPSRSEQFSQAGCPFVSSHNGGSCTLALAAGQRLTAVIWGASGAQLVTTPSLLRIQLQGPSGEANKETDHHLLSFWNEGKPLHPLQTDCWRPAGCPSSAFSPSPLPYFLSLSASGKPLSSSKLCPPYLTLGFT